MTKAQRQARILGILRAREMRTQEELTAALAREGARASQVTLSRDLRELGVVKTARGYRQADAVGANGGPPGALSQALKQFLVGADRAANLVVLKTRPGGAGAVALAMDGEDWDDIVGTVAGDDTIFVATRGAKAARRVRERVLELW